MNLNLNKNVFWHDCAGECYLEWEGKGKPDKPLLKDKYASERRKVGGSRVAAGWQLGGSWAAAGG